MTLEDLADIAQIVASFGVIVSLIYLARQVVQNTRMMRAGVSSDRVQRDFDLTSPIFNNRDFAEKWCKARDGLDALDEIDQVRVVMHSRSALKHWHNMFAMRRQHLVSDADWDELLWLIQHFGGIQNTRAAWAMFKDSFEKPFQDFIEQQFAIADRDKDNA
jgi:hypothetical protein